MKDETTQGTPILSLHDSIAAIQPFYTMFRTIPSAFAGLAEMYCRSLQTHPLLTKALSSATIMGASDLACQTIEQRPPWVEQLLQSMNCNNVQILHAKQSTNSRPLRYNWNRTLQVCVVGLVWAGPISHYWYNIVERYVRIPHRVGALMARILMDAALFSPVAGKCDGTMVVCIWNCQSCPCLTTNLARLTDFQSLDTLRVEVF